MAILGSRLKAEAWLAMTAIKRIAREEVMMSPCQVLKAYNHSLSLPPSHNRETVICSHPCTITFHAWSHDTLGASPWLLSTLLYSQKFALTTAVDWLEGGCILFACWLLSDYLQGPGVSAARRPLPVQAPLYSWPKNWSRRIWGHPSTSTLLPPSWPNCLGQKCF